MSVLDLNYINRESDAEALWGFDSWAVVNDWVRPFDQCMPHALDNAIRFTDYDYMGEDEEACGWYVG